MEIFRVNEKQYGWIFSVIAMGVIGSAQVNNFVLRRYSSEQVIKIATLCQSVVGIVLAVMSYFGWGDLYSTIFLIFLFLGGQGFIFPNASALSLAPFPHTAGSASALMGAIQMGIGAGVSALVSVLQNGTRVPMAVVMACCATTAFASFFLGSKLIIYRAGLNAVEEEDVEMVSTL
jgi:MFS transporter, DHA1 family, multidrug resistance protein